MQAEPQAEHRWLEKFVGDWTSVAEASMGPDQPNVKFKGTNSVRSIGGVWTINEGQGETPGGGTTTMIITLGYDPAKKKFVGTFIGSMMTHMWIYEGDLVGNVLTLDTVGPSFADPTKLAKYQDIIEVVDDDHHILSSRTLGDDGKWVPFMTAHYHRKK